MAWPHRDLNNYPHCSGAKCLVPMPQKKSESTWIWPKIRYIFSGWCFQPLWKIWLRQLGWLFPIYGKMIHSCSKPRFIPHFMAILREWWFTCGWNGVHYDTPTSVILTNVWVCYHVSSFLLYVLRYCLTVWQKFDSLGKQPNFETHLPTLNQWQGFYVTLW